MFRSDDTNFMFSPGRLTAMLDGGAGSSGKGKLGSFIAEHADNWQFCCNTFTPQAGHWVYLDDGTHYFYQTLNSCAYQPYYEKMYIGPGSIIELPALFREMEENNVRSRKLGISPVCGILQDIDAAFERGEVDLDGAPIDGGEGTMKHGSTCHGVGAAVARRRLRRQNVKLARDIPELQEFLCDVPGEIMGRLDKGQSGFLEISQGYQLSYLIPEMYPFCTSRNCTVAAGFDDMMLPICYAGPVAINFRTFPIRISNYKYIATEPFVCGVDETVEKGQHLTWDQVQWTIKSNQGHLYEKYEGSSGPGYPDQEETDWLAITEDSGSNVDLTEMTSVTKLPRRVFTPSRQNMTDAINHNRTGWPIYISLNFINYLQANLKCARGHGWDRHEIRNPDRPTTRKFRESESCSMQHVQDWCRHNIPSDRDAKLTFLGTGPYTDDFVVV